ncbi:hypothetical protein M8J76_015410 [Diaphorina citri]|nr:hypothetical protein M8J76_015410 [Diaphorina citri]
MNCGKCIKVLPDEENELDFTTCARCQRSYHFECCAVSASSWKSMGTTRRSQWKCPICRDAEKSRAPQENVAVDKTNIGAMLEGMTKKWDVFEKKVSSKLDDFEANLNYDVQYLQRAGSLKIASVMRMESISELQVPLIRIIDDNDVAILHVAEDEAPSRDKYEDQPPLQAPAVFMHTLDVPGQSYVVTAQRRQDSYRFIRCLRMRQKFQIRQDSRAAVSGVNSPPWCDVDC